MCGALTPLQYVFLCFIKCRNNLAAKIPILAWNLFALKTDYWKKSEGKCLLFR
jgi:hypothetical protein